VPVSGNEKGERQENGRQQETQFLARETCAYSIFKHRPTASQHGV